MQVLYFAYGSNMSSKHFRLRISSAKLIGSAYLKDKKMVFNKGSIDNSGKANLVDSIGDVTWGVLYEIDAQDFGRLDQIEGGYRRVQVRVFRSEGRGVNAVTYLSANLISEPVAYDWYKELVISGAREHNLPQEYIAYLEQLPSKPDRTQSGTVG